MADMGGNVILAPLAARNPMVEDLDGNGYAILDLSKVETNALLGTISEAEINKLDGAGLFVDNNGELRVDSSVFDGTISGISNPLTENLDASGYDIDNVGSVSTGQANIDSYSVDLTKTTDQSLSGNTDTTVDWDLQDVDTDLYTYNQTQDTIDIAAAGDYRVTGALRIDGVSDQDLTQVRIFINGARGKTPDLRASGSISSGSFSALLKGLSSGDTIRIDIRVGSGGTLKGNNSVFASISKEA